jgi:hypothetical protein
MNKIQRITLGLALLATITCGGASASANGNKQRAMSGTVQRVDLQSRTIEVRDQESGRVITIRVPEGASLQTSSGAQRNVQIERLLPGMALRDVVVQ